MRHAARSGRAIAEVWSHRFPVSWPVGSTVVEPGPAQSGLRPPQQARSRAALQRLLTSAEHVLVNEGPEEFTIARVAEHAGVSVGGVYRRFASKEQLIDAIRHALLERLEEAVTEAFDKAEPSLGGVIDAFASALSQTLAENGRIIPALLAGGRSVDVPEQGLRTVTSLQQTILRRRGASPEADPPPGSCRGAEHCVSQRDCDRGAPRRDITVVAGRVDVATMGPRNRRHDYGISDRRAFQQFSRKVKRIRFSALRFCSMIPSSDR